VPHSGQKKHFSGRPLSELRSNIFSSPCTLTPACGTIRLMPKALPDWRWHSVQ
jgi:hypothetical protein